MGSAKTGQSQRHRPDHQLRIRHGVRHGHQVRAHEADDEPEGADHERAPEEQPQGRQRGHQAEAQPRLIHCDDQEEERHGQADREGEQGHDAEEQGLAGVLRHDAERHERREVCLRHLERHAQHERHDTRDDDADRADRSARERRQLATEKREQLRRAGAPAAARSQRGPCGGRSALSGWFWLAPISENDRHGRCADAEEHPPAAGRRC